MNNSTSSEPDAISWKRILAAPEYLFPVLLALFGVAFAFGMPPFQTPDEDSHFFRAYQVSEGRLFPHRTVDGWGGGLVPASMVRILHTFLHLVFHPDRHASWEDFTNNLDTPLDPKAREARPFRGSTYYSFVPYLPQALGIALARVSGGGALGVFYACRLANLVFAVLLLHLTLRITPIFKLVFGALALIPITVQQLASSSPDASTIGVAFLFTAVLFRLAVAERATVGGGMIVVLLGLAGWLTVCKFPYASLALLYLAIPLNRLGGWRRYLLVGAGLAVVTLGLTVAMTRMKKYTPDRISEGTREVSIRGQVRGIKADPLKFAGVCTATITEHSRIWLDQLGQLGWLDTPVNPLAMQTLLVFLVLLGLGDRTESIQPSWQLKTAGLLAAGLCTGVILLCCYVSGCSVGAPLVIGPQGRYWVPVLPLLMLPLFNRVIRIQANPKVLLYATCAVSAAVLVVAVASFMRRYYLAPEFQFEIVPIALGSAALLVALYFVAVGRRYAAA